ncbi:sigma-54 dependent transcriptional regulator [Sphingomonas sp. 1P06PA]|uniref:sigma-54-dependent transcriptional regulator n=1 Tax=Sphingomonas sp. 1P06PA TaxID=554121 RepID=UPI0039A76A8C
MSDPAPVALVEDDIDVRVATAQLLSIAGHATVEFADAASALAAIGADFPGVVLSDIRMPGQSGVELLRALRERDAELPVILMTGHGDVATAVAALKAGAWDFLIKPCDPDLLLSAIARAAAARSLTLENRRLRIAAEAAGADELVGHSPAIRRLRASVATLANTELDIIVEGDSGTGKQLLARSIHRAGHRVRHRFVLLDCAAPPANVSELFGAQGPIARAERGTLFLDNLEGADQALQLRLAQFAEHRLIATDSRAPQPVDVRIIAAIEGRAADRVLPALYHRIAAVVLSLPPLVARGEDLQLLIAHFLATLSRKHRRNEPPLAAAAGLLARRDWPGNVRELEYAVERLVLGLDDAIGSETADMDTPLPERMRAFERAIIMDALLKSDGEVPRALRSLGIPRETFYYRVKRLGIDLTELRPKR